jgi:hypothetical protein
VSESHSTPIERARVGKPLGSDQPFEIQAKGIGFRSFFFALERLRGDEMVTRTIERLPDDLQEAVVLGKIGANDWHPIAWYRELHRAARAVTGEGPELARLIGFESVRRDFEGPLRALTFVLAPQAVVRRGPRIFRTYYNPGQMYVLDAQPGRLRVHWNGCAGFDTNLWNDVIGGCEAVLRACGARSVDLRVISGAGEHDARAEIMAWWA